MDRNHQVVEPLALDLEAYRPEIAHLGMTREKEDEFITALWWIMKSFVDRAWGDDPVQHVHDSRSEAEKSAARMVESWLETNSFDDASQASDSFQAAADGRKEDS